MRSKLDAKAFKGMFIGYGYGHLGEMGFIGYAFLRLKRLFAVEM